MPSPNGVQQVNVGGSVGTGAQSADNPVFIAGWDGTLLRAILTDTSGRITLAGSGTVGSAAPASTTVIGVQDAAGNVRIPTVDKQNTLFVDPESQRVGYRAAGSFTQTGTGFTFTIQGFAGKTIRITRIGINAYCGTTVQLGLNIRKYSTLYSGGVSVTNLAVPLSSSFVAATAVSKYWTTAPTAGTSVGDVVLSTVGVVGTTGSNQYEYTFGDKSTPALYLNNANEYIGVLFSFGGTNVTYSVYFEWTEE